MSGVTLAPPSASPPHSEDPPPLLAPPPLLGSQVSIRNIQETELGIKLPFIGNSDSAQSCRGSAFLLEGVTPSAWSDR